MSAPPSVTEADALTALRAFLAAVLAPAVEIIRGQDNRVGEPSCDDYVVMTPGTRMRLSTNVVGYTDTAGAPGVPAVRLRSSRQSTELTVQLDVHGPASADNAQVLTTLLQDGFAAEHFAAGGTGVAPLYASDPRQVPFVSGENQYEDRWIIDVALQVSPVVSTPQEFADQVHIAPAPAANASRFGDVPDAPGALLAPIP